MKNKKEQQEYWALLRAEEGFVVDVLERLCENMERAGVSRSELARRLGTSPQYVTKMLRGDNITLRTLARVVHHLDGVPELRVRNKAQAGIHLAYSHRWAQDASWARTGVVKQARPPSLEEAPLAQVGGA